VPPSADINRRFPVSIATRPALNWDHHRCKAGKNTMPWSAGLARCVSHGKVAMHAEGGGDLLDCNYLLADFGNGFGRSGLAVLAVAYFWTNTSRVFLFWAAFILTRPLGATVGDFLDKPMSDGGLALSRPIASAVIGAFIVACLLILPQRAGQHPGQSVTATGDGAPDGAGRSSDAGRTLTECLLRHLVRRTEMSASSAILQSLWKMSAAYQKSRFLRCKMSLIVAGMAKRKRTAMTTLD
jgi:hypothetical protein